MDNVIVQVPVNKTLRDQATIAATDLGFSSLQESIRIFMAKLAKRQISVDLSTNQTAETLSPRAIKRYEKMVKDVRSGKTKTQRFDNVDDLFEYLNA